ncbi:hypothetical protein [Chitinophaga sp. 212800010-3]|uniref:hypothetical protein n=1 Tax=unclassified Chitinophaga TaxID=2619133 RepID=UPI002DF4984D|nr:Peptidase S74 domain-containing protein [Chitinophaga sp. 212800010-3]
MKSILKPWFLLPFLAILISLSSNAQVDATFKVNGDSAKFYPVVFTDSAFDHHVASELEVGRAWVHTDGPWHGSLIAKFRYHTTNWGNGSNFIDADIRQYTYTQVYKYDKFVAGWRDATPGNGDRRIIIWLRGGGITYFYKSRFNDKVFVFDDTPGGLLPYNEKNGDGVIAHTYKTDIDSYVNTYGMSYNNNTNFNGSTNYFAGRVGVGTPVNARFPAQLEINNAPAWTPAGWGKAIRLAKAQSIAFDAGSRKFGIGASSDSILYLFSTDSDTSNTDIRYDLVLTKGGNFGIGTVKPGSYKLAVEGLLGARKIRVTQQSTWADFVFHPNYQLPALAEVENYIRQNGHLPEIPSAAEVKENGVDVGEMNKLLLQKVEELTLYLIRQQKEINELKSRLK